MEIIDQAYDYIISDQKGNMTPVQISKDKFIACIDPLMFCLQQDLSDDLEFDINDDSSPCISFDSPDYCVHCIDEKQSEIDDYPIFRSPYCCEQCSITVYSIHECRNIQFNGAIMISYRDRTSIYPAHGDIIFLTEYLESIFTGIYSNVQDNTDRFHVCNIRYVRPRIYRIPQFSDIDIYL